MTRSLTGTKGQVVLPLDFLSDIEKEALLGAVLGAGTIALGTHSMMSGGAATMKAAKKLTKFAPWKSPRKSMGAAFQGIARGTPPKLAAKIDVPSELRSTLITPYYRANKIGGRLLAPLVNLLQKEKEKDPSHVRGGLTNTVRIQLEKESSFSAMVKPGITAGVKQTTSLFKLRAPKVSFGTKLSKPSYTQASERVGEASQMAPKIAPPPKIMPTGETI